MIRLIWIWSVLYIIYFSHAWCPYAWTGGTCPSSWKANKKLSCCCDSRSYSTTTYQVDIAIQSTDHIAWNSRGPWSAREDLYLSLQFQTEVSFWSPSAAAVYRIAVFPASFFAERWHSLCSGLNNASYSKSVWRSEEEMPCYEHDGISFKYSNLDTYPERHNAQRYIPTDVSIMPSRSYCVGIDTSPVTTAWYPWNTTKCCVLR